MTRHASFRILALSATALLSFAPHVRAQTSAPQTSAPQTAAPAASTQNASFKAALKQFCPTKNLEFLKPDTLAKATDDFVAALPAEKRSQVVQLAHPGVAACAGSADESCRTAAVLGSVRYLDLSVPLAQSVCSLKVACRDWFDCSAEQAAVATAPAPPAEPPVVAPAPEPRPSDLAQNPQTVEPDEEGPPTPAPRPAPARPRTAQAPQDLETAATPRPSAPEGGGTARDAVAGFYGALGRGDGIDAAHFLIPEKRGRGPFSAQAMSRFYGGMRRPLRLEGVWQVGPSTVRARYNFVARDGSRCDGQAVISVRETAAGSQIESIRALSGC
ncbi:hypothetical protein GCM10007036_26320 [Alsobacter metallidurans]|uniref:Uncharacterized protein n=1 Tax=Alsobacter metallidurans TaxID=340221 RepID=A0A917MK50_9HYPH|nr:hypothetical protein [Alsobacter metallidurans]GGH21784.1 hypothetical protein GCM10007036_26320 [Alsobacter metallidurans]